jgi:hypothetical protein
MNEHLLEQNRDLIVELKKLQEEHNGLKQHVGLSHGIQSTTTMDMAASEITNTSGFETSSQQSKLVLLGNGQLAIIQEQAIAGEETIESVPHGLEKPSSEELLDDNSIPFAVHNEIVNNVSILYLFKYFYVLQSKTR